MELRDLFLIADASLLLVSVPLILQRVAPNHFYGLRTPRTLANPGLWYRANRYAGQVLTICAIASAIAILLLPDTAANGVTGAALFGATIAVGVIASLLRLRSMR